jgi:hypothetical protein
MPAISWSRLKWNPDVAVFLVVATRLSLLVAAPVTLWIVATRRPLAEQGLFFIAWNFQAVTQLMELGVGTLIVQFASHESSFLGWDSRGCLIGDAESRLRIRRVIQDGRRWYGVIASALFVLASAGGAWVVGLHQVGELAACIATAAFTALYLTLVPALCAIEGCNGLIRVQRMRLAQAWISIAVLWATIIGFGSLWGVAAFSAAWFTVASTWLTLRHRHFTAATETTIARYDGRLHEPTTLGNAQSRSGASWLVWWAVPQSVTPIVLATHGREAAGRIGMTFAIATASLTLAIAWLQARYPQYAALISQGELGKLKQLVRSATSQAAIVSTVGAIGATGVVWLIGELSPALAARALSPIWIAVLGGTNLAWVLIQSAGSYLRAWREEPLMETTVVGGAVVVAGTLGVALRLSTEATLATYSLLVVSVLLPLVLLQSSRRLRHLLRAMTDLRTTTN